MQATDISANLHNKVTKSRISAKSFHEMGVAHAVSAYAAKVLRELHESQVVAGKGAGTDRLPGLSGKQVTNFTKTKPQGSSGSIMRSRMPTTP